ncbi:hypothetical protein ASPWEDRAFT_45086 [Aspergillus wentii DTO 134E9]|uniref:Uncharacterized protein n=1 Tax=Aspergillus wentii DTO 134E9 TaxID=1073089 RepID=A0A1L9R8D4_ASPWE|nr:uncharacterized protein ASPWEDRAFT_45086 [Aspergillus wentii DTO 134E9]KAI9924963.1 hypothetical protein MW887_006370 [Aspergillus wentii]OJJ31127.1 hypothetical protein ASPWEDRAFT_45086 [Aspergillus wentii DTO 134E9]
MPLLTGGANSIPNSVYYYGYVLITCLLLQGAAAGKSDLPGGRVGYTYGQPMPVTCLNRTIDSGEHITDDLGKLQYIPFPTCNETFLPLALRYGVTETVNCTINSLPDELYHLLEYYVHSDVPLACRVPTAPLVPSGPASDENKRSDETNGGADISLLGDGGPSYTPLTFALQGTLQLSHLHIWTDMNVLAHNIPSISAKKNKKQSKKAPGYIVAGTAYSVPEFDVPLLQGEKKSSSNSNQEKEDLAVAEAARDPWTDGHGTKVVRGEPLTFTFHVSWVEGGGGIGWPSRFSSADGSSGGAFFSKLFFFILAASVGAMAALYYERNGGFRQQRWRGDGILGVPSRGPGAVGITYGNGGKINGYGGYSAGSASMPGNGVGYGYGGFSTGKRD